MMWDKGDFWVCGGIFGELKKNKRGK